MERPSDRAKRLSDRATSSPYLPPPAAARTHTHTRTHAHRPTKVANATDTAKILNNVSPLYWPTTKEKKTKLLNAFNTEPLNISWDMDVVGGYTATNSIPLEPGYVYTLHADVSVQPIYRELLDTYQNMMGYTNMEIIGWKKGVISTSITKTEATYFKRHTTTVRYVIKWV